MLSIRTLIYTMGLTALLAGCARDGGTATGTWQGETETAGNMTTVRTLSGSLWGGMARLVEEASIGGREGDEAHMLGDVRGIAATEDVIYVIDLAVPVVHMYNHHGQHLRDFGREGDGPGEFRRPVSIGIDRNNDRIFVRDGMMARINVYTMEGIPRETWWIRSTRPFLSPIVVGSEGTPYTQIILNPAAPSMEWQMGMAGCGPQGAVGDTIPVPRLDFTPPQLVFPGGTRGNISIPLPLGPEIVWAMTADRAMIVGASHAYQFEIHHPDGRVIVVEKPWPRVAVQKEEAAWYKGQTTARINLDAPGWVWDGPEIPDHKPAFQQFIPDADGRIWVVRPGPGRRLEGGVQQPEQWREYFTKPCWEDTYLLDVFEEGGRYLGPVEVPAGMQFYPPPFISDNMVVALVSTDDGTPHVKRYRLLLP